MEVQENVELETAPAYEALSFTWGDYKKECSISCGSESIEITANLAAALLQLRSPDKARALWIDQICINQDDVEERNKQVALMRKIFSEAENVVIWLGEEGPDDEMAFGYQMGHLASDAENAHDAVAAITEFHSNDHGRGNNIVDALFVSYRFKCTDPRDKVFAMLGLVHALVLQLSYAARIEDVYLTTTQSLIHEFGNLDILCCVSHPKTIATFPSRVPNWQAQVAVKRKLGKSTIRAPDTPRQQVSYSDNHRTLMVEGWCVASVATVTNVFTRDESGLLIGWNEFVEKVIHVESRSSSELHRRTLLAGECLPGITSDEDFHLAYEAWQNLLTRCLGPLTNLPDENEEGSGFDCAMTETCVGRRLFATAQHNLRLAPGEARVGDAVCFLGNTSTPFVLRPRGSYFEFVGESYVHDFVEKAHPLLRLTKKEDKREFRIR
ncbi:heterokaryon incompatibility protein-domain-containing protein [Usnea florida]